MNSFLPTVTEKSNIPYCLCTVHSATSAINSYLPTFNQTVNSTYCLCRVQSATVANNSYFSTVTQTTNITYCVQYSQLQLQLIATSQQSLKQPKYLLSCTVQSATAAITSYLPTVTPTVDSNYCLVQCSQLYLQSIATFQQSFTQQYLLSV